MSEEQKYTFSRWYIKSFMLVSLYHIHVHNIAHSDAIILLYNVRHCSTSCKVLLREQGTVPSSCLSNARNIQQGVSTKLCLYMSKHLQQLPNNVSLQINVLQIKEMFALLLNQPRLSLQVFPILIFLPSIRT